MQSVAITRASAFEQNCFERSESQCWSTEMEDIPIEKVDDTPLGTFIDSRRYRI